MTKQFSLLQLFSIVDGRLSTKLEDVYIMLNHICDTELMTHNLPTAMDYLKSKNPKWFAEVEDYITLTKARLQSSDFAKVTDFIRRNLNPSFQIPQLKDEFDTSDFENYMLDNSLLLKHFN